MAIKSYFFDSSASGDRKYGAADFAKYFSKFINNGVLMNSTSDLLVSPNSTPNNTYTVKPGFMFINGYFIHNDADVTNSATMPTTNNRIDRITISLRLNDRTIVINRLVGTEAANPVPPTLTRTATRWDMCIAELHLKKDATSIKAEDIKDTRFDLNLCGVITGFLDFTDHMTFRDNLLETFTDWLDTKMFQLGMNPEEFLESNITTLYNQGAVLLNNLNQLDANTVKYKPETPIEELELPLEAAVEYDESHLPKIRRIGKFVEIIGGVTGVFETNIVVAIVPVGFRPLREIQWTDVTSTQGGKCRSCRWRLRTNGELVMMTTEDGLISPIPKTFFHFHKIYQLSNY